MVWHGHNPFYYIGLVALGLQVSRVLIWLFVIVGTGVDVYSCVYACVCVGNKATV